MKKQYILFDLDGTISDPKEGITKAVAYALKNYGIEIENREKLCPFIGPPLKESFMTFYEFNEEQALEAIEKYREYFSEIGIYENKLYEDMKEVLEELQQRGKILAVATSKPTVFAEHIVKHFKLEKYFSFISGSELDGTRVDKGEVIQYALDRLGVEDRAEVIMIGDRKHDILGAKKLGIETIGILHGYGDREELEKAGANYIISKINELLGLVN